MQNIIACNAFNLNKNLLNTCSGLGELMFIMAEITLINIQMGTQTLHIAY